MTLNLLKTIPGGWVAGWVAGQVAGGIKIKANSVKFQLKLPVGNELGNKEIEQNSLGTGKEN